MSEHKITIRGEGVIGLISVCIAAFCMVYGAVHILVTLASWAFAL